MTIDELTLYHWHTYESDRPALQVGQEYSTAAASNRFWSFYENCSLRFPSVPYTGNFAVAASRHFLEDNAFDNQELTRQMVHFLHDAVFEMGMFVRELTFEEIRRSRFSNLPSRRRCTFLCLPSDVDFWSDWFRDAPMKKTLFETTCSGVAHYGHQGHLNSDSMNFTEYTKNALEYWEGRDSQIPSPVEIILEGKMKIERLVKTL